MIKGREKRISELITKYKYWNIQEENAKKEWTDKWAEYIARDNKRAIKKRFLKEFHESIENFLKRG